MNPARPLEQRLPAGLPGRQPLARARTVVRASALTTIALAALALAWVIVVWRWQDPFTALYTAHQQHKLANRYEQRARAFASHTLPSLAAEARRYRLGLRPGDPVGRLIVPHLGLNAIVVNGTDEQDLKKGPGRYLGTFLPGEGQLVYIAGHRTTYGAPFAHIERLRPGDRIRFELPYATFLYRVRSHEIVNADDLRPLRSHNHELLALQACHPRFFATHRYIVYAAPVRAIPASNRHR